MIFFFWYANVKQIGLGAEMFRQRGVLDTQMILTLQPSARRSKHWVMLAGHIKLGLINAQAQDRAVDV